MDLNDETPVKVSQIYNYPIETIHSDLRLLVLSILENGQKLHKKQSQANWKKTEHNQQEVKSLPRG